MADMTVVSANVRALTSHGALVIPGVAGGTITLGYAVYAAYSTGLWVHADGNVSAEAASVIGIAVESFDGEDTVITGNALSICVMGPVGGFTDLVAGDVYWLSDTVGRIADAAATFDRIVGRGVPFAGQNVLWVGAVSSDAAS